MHNTKKALLTSAVALLLCFVMLAGSTFAWFTDVAISSGNVIQSGNLDIALMKGTPNGNGGWNWDENNGEAIFDYDKWEPGYTTWAALAVENHGSLAAKWKAQITLNGAPTILADVIEIYSTYDHLFNPDARPDFNDGTWQKMGTVRELLDNDGLLLPGGTIDPDHRQPIVVALHMREDANNNYQNLDLGANFDIKIIATQASFEDDSYGKDYDVDAEWPKLEAGYYASAIIDSNNLILGALTSEMQIGGNGIGATIPADVKVAEGATSLDLSMKKADNSNLNLDYTDSATSYDVHIEGIAADNTQPMIVNLGAVLPKGLSYTSLKLYHTENGTPELMTRVNSAAEFAIHNQYTYDSATGEVSIYVASFSVFTAVKTTADVWDGKSDTSWYVGHEADSVFTIKTAEQLAGFRDLVDAGVTFAGKTVKLDTDIDLNKTPFDPIGFSYTYNKDSNTAFMGTFDGQKHTIYNLYQNGWELDSDKTNYSTYTYSTAGAGLFASIEGTKDSPVVIKNLAISGAEIVFECVDMGIVVGYAQGVCHFENIVVTNSQIANYNRYTGGVVGEVSYGPYGIDTSLGYSHTFKNITVDSTVTVSGLWGSFGCGMGGVIGGKWGDATVKMENVISAPVMDVYNDVVSAYQWYAFRGCGMLIGHTEEPYSDGRHSGNATAKFLTCENVFVYYGDWVNYTYYEFENQDNPTGQKYPWVRAEEGKYCDAFSNIRYGVPTHNGIKVSDLTEEELKAIATDYTPIVFDQLYGADRGMYGTNKHEGVTVVYKNSKTIYFQNNWNWTNLKLHYWFENGEDRWTTVADGVDVSNLTSTKVGGYDVYAFEIPVYIAGFKIEGYDSTTKTTHTTEEVTGEHIIENNIYWFVHSAGNYGIATNAYNNNANFQTHDIYVIGSMNNWSTENLDSKYHFTSYSNGKWTLSVTFDTTTTIKLYNKLVVSDGYAGWINKDGTTDDVELAPGKYTITYNVANNNFTFTMTERKIYLMPTGWEGGARFAAYVWNGSGNKWISMTKESDGTWSCYVPVSYSNIIFGRMNNSQAANNWNTCWNQSVDETIPTNGNNLWTVKTPYGSNNQSNGSWSRK